MSQVLAGGLRTVAQIQADIATFQAALIAGCTATSYTYQGRSLGRISPAQCRDILKDLQREIFVANAVQSQNRNPQNSRGRVWGTGQS